MESTGSKRNLYFLEMNKLRRCFILVLPTFEALNITETCIIFHKIHYVPT